MKTILIITIILLIGYFLLLEINNLDVKNFIKKNSVNSKVVSCYNKGGTNFSFSYNNYNDDIDYKCVKEIIIK